MQEKIVTMDSNTKEEDSTQQDSNKEALSKAEEESMALLPEHFMPGKWDVICQRGKECYDHVGNRRFRMIIDSHLETYMENISRRQKTKIVTTIVKNIRAAAGSGGGFVRKVSSSIYSRTLLL